MIWIKDMLGSLLFKMPEIITLMNNSHVVFRRRSKLMQPCFKLISLGFALNVRNMMDHLKANVVTQIKKVSGESLNIRLVIKQKTFDEPPGL